MKDFTTKPGDVTLFKNAKINDRSPDHSGFIIVHRDIRAGEKIGISLWNGKPGSSKTLGGSVKDYYVKDPKKAALDKAVDAAVEYSNKNRAPIEDESSDLPF